VPLTVTFDTNTFASVVEPETAQRGTGAAGSHVRKAIQAGHVQGFFCETIVTLEGITNSDRTFVFGTTTVAGGHRHEMKEDGSGITYSDRRVEQPGRKALDPRQDKRFTAAFDLGMKLLVGSTRVGRKGVDDPDGTRYQHEEEHDQARRVDRYYELATAIEARGLGCAQARHIADEIRAQVGGGDPFEFYLGRPRNNCERKKINLAIREWSDGDSIAAHYGYGIELFCTEDHGKNAGGPSVLNDDNRKWLNNEFGIQLVTLAELAGLVST
jgi:hypothetical protein